MGEAVLSTREYAFVGFRKKLSRNSCSPCFPETDKSVLIRRSELTETAPAGRPMPRITRSRGAGASAGVKESSPRNGLQTREA